MEEELVRSQTASRMLSLFRQMETSGSQDNVPAGPKPLKCFTPPPDYRPDNSEGSDEEESEEEESEEEADDDDDDRIPGVIRASDKIEDEFLKSVKIKITRFFRFFFLNFFVIYEINLTELCDLGKERCPCKDPQGQVRAVGEQPGAARRRG